MPARDDFGSRSGRGGGGGVSDLANGGVARRAGILEMIKQAVEAPAPSARPGIRPPKPKLKAVPTADTPRAVPPKPNMRPPVQGTGVGPLPPVNYANPTDTRSSYWWNSGYRQSPFSPGGAPYRESDDLEIDPVNNRLIRPEKEQRLAGRRGYELAGPSGYAETPYYTPVPGMGPLPYDPAETDLVIDPATGRVAYRHNLTPYFGGSR